MKILSQAFVIGAGIAGLVAAKAAASHFEKVILVERDDLPQSPQPRPGAAQSWHAHYFLAGGLKALLTLFPDIDKDLAKAGALKSRIALDVRFERPGFDPFPQRDLGLEAFSQSRPLLEWICRLRLKQQPNVEIQSRARVIAIVPNKASDGVGFVRCEGADGFRTFPADLVIDASGRAEPSLSLLDQLGWAKPARTEIGVDLAYATAEFARPQGSREWIGLAHFSGPSHKSRAGLILEVEGGRWTASLIGMHGDAPPGDIEGFLQFAKSFRLPTFYDALRSGTQLAEIARFRLPASVRLDFGRLARFPRGLIPLGDALCRFNPVFGQGMSVAIQEAKVLGRLLAARRLHPDPLENLSKDYLRDVEHVLEAPWATATLDLAHPNTRGERPPDIENRVRYVKALQSLAAEDADVHRTMAEVNHLVKPYSNLREPRLAERVVRRMQELG